MAKQTIEMKVTSDSSQAVSDNAKLLARLDKLEDSYEKAGKASVKATKASANSVAKLEKELKDARAELNKMEIGSKQFDEQGRKVASLTRNLNAAKSAVGGVTASGSRLTAISSKVGANIAGLAAGFVGIQSAVSAIREEFDKVKRNQLQAAATTRTFEESLADIAFNVGGANLQDTRKLVEENAPKLGTTQEGLANLIGIAVSAGAKDIQEALSVSSAALEATAGDATKSVELVQSALDIASLAGSQNFRGALGQVSQTQSQVRAVNASEFFSNLGPAIAAATADRANIDAISTERTLELSSVVSQILKDRTGANTATAVRQFVTRLDSFTPKLEATLKDGSKAEVSQEVIDAFRGTRDVDERIQLFRENVGLQRQFLAKQKEGIGKGAIAEIIGGTQRAIAIEQKAAAGISSIDDAESSFGELVDAVNENTVVLQAERKNQAAIQAARTQGAGALQGQARKILQDAIEEIDLPGSDFLGARAIEADLKFANDQGANLAQTGLDILGQLDEDNRSIFAFWTRRLNDQERATVERTKEQLRALQPLIDQAVAQQEMLQIQRDQKEILMQMAEEGRKQKVQPVRNVDAGPVEAPPAAAGVP